MYSYRIGTASYLLEVELVHGDDLRVTSPCSSSLDTKCWSLAGLPHTGEHVLPELRSNGLHQADGRRRFSLAERGRSDPSHADVSPGLPGGQSLQGAQGHLGFLLPVQIHFRGKKANLRSEKVNILGSLSSGNLDIRGDFLQRIQS